MKHPKSFHSLTFIAMLACACGPQTNTNNTNTTNNKTPECEEDSACKTGEFCTFERTCQKDPFGGDTRMSKALFFPSQSGDTFEFDDFINLGPDDKPAPGTCLDAYRDRTGKFRLPKSFLEGVKVGDSITIEQGLRYYGQSSELNNAFDIQAVRGSLEITAVNDDTLSGSYSFFITDLLISPDETCADTSEDGMCSEESGTFEAAIVCKPQ